MVKMYHSTVGEAYQTIKYQNEQADYIKKLLLQD